MTILIKLTSGNIFIQVEKNRQGSATVTKQLIIFLNADNSTTLTLPGSPGVSREAKFSTEFEFGPKTHRFQKTSKTHHFLLFFLSFLRFFEHSSY